MKKLIFILFLGIIFSCKKEKLDGDAEILIGKWNWIYTTQFTTYPNIQYSTPLTPSNQGKTIAIEFLKKGKVHFYEDGNCIEKRRIVSLDSYGWNGNEWGFSIRLNKKEDDRINNLNGYAYIQNDSITIKIWEHPFEDDFSLSRRNFFLKEQ